MLADHQLKPTHQVPFLHVFFLHNVVDHGIMYLPENPYVAVTCRGIGRWQHSVLHGYSACVQRGVEGKCTVHADPANPITAVLSCEIGGANGLEPLCIGARLGLPIVDADFMGRAFPELQARVACCLIRHWPSSTSFALRHALIPVSMHIPFHVLDSVRRAVDIC